VPTGIIGTVVVTGVFYLLVDVAETLALGRDGIPGFAQSGSPLGDLTAAYWSPSALWVIDLVITLTGLGFVIAVANAAIRVVFAMGREGVLPASVATLSSRRSPVVALGCVVVVSLALGLPLTLGIGGARTFGYLVAAGSLSIVLVYLMVNLAVMRAFRTEFRDEFRLWRHALIPGTATVVFLFSLWGVVHPSSYTLQTLLPFVSLAWLALGVVVVAVLRRRRGARLSTLGQYQAPETREPAAELAEPELPETA
jgi:amino acid transporter